MNTIELAYPFIKKRHFAKKRRLEEKKRNYTFVSNANKQLFLHQFFFEGYKIFEVLLYT